VLRQVVVEQLRPHGAGERTPSRSERRYRSLIPSRVILRQSVVGLMSSC
jgi:hypothetical protein